MKLKHCKELDKNKYASFKELQLDNFYFIEDDIYIDRRSRTVKITDEDNNEYYLQIFDVLHSFKPVIYLPRKDKYMEFSVPRCILDILKKVVKIGTDEFEYRSFNSDRTAVEKEIKELGKWTKRFGSELENVSFMEMDSCITVQFRLLDPLASILINNKIVRVHERVYRRPFKVKRNCESGILFN